VKGGCIGELITCKLNPVAGIACEQNRGFRGVEGCIFHREKNSKRCKKLGKGKEKIHHSIDFYQFLRLSPCLAEYLSVSTGL
jgi:hypothetical protein